MNNKKTGDAAFPRMSHTNCFDVMLPEQDGMALRDYFAAKAMQAVLTRESFFHNEPFEKGVSQWCYSMADEMLKAREK